MKVSVESLQGYILEEVLAYLIKTTGYDLLVDPKQDENDLDWAHNGLVVKGRGGIHQVDVLGQLSWVPAFTFPLRLVIEAKFRRPTAGIQTVRNAIGVILDINQNNSPTREQKVILQKYQYVYAIFSTSGFSQPAQDMALAHQISLIDLSGNEYSDLRNTIGNSARRMSEWLSQLTDEAVRRTQIVASTRYQLRKALGTWPSELTTDRDLPRTSPNLDEYLSPVITATRQYNEVFVGMANGPYMLLMKADNPTRFVNYCKEHPKHDVQIHWKDRSSPWTIKPSDNSNAYGLSFMLPERISRWIFDSAYQDARRRAWSVKRQIFSSITILRREDKQDYFFNLEFDPEQTLSRPSER